MIRVPFDAVSARFHRAQLHRTWTVLSNPSPATEDIQRLAQTNRAEYLDFLRKVSSPLADRMTAALSGTSSVPGAVDTTSREEILSLRRKTLPLDSSLFRRYAERTSGSHGKPFSVRRTSHSLQREMLRLRWSLGYHAAHRGCPVPETIIYLSHYPRASSYTYVDQTQAPLRIVKHAIGEESLERDIETINNSITRRFVLAGTPSTLQLLARSQRHLKRAPEFAITSGEAHPPALKDAVSAWLGAPVFEHYVMREVGLLGVECTEAEGFHLFDTDLVVTAPAGRLLITDVTNCIDLYVNYQTDDTGEITSAQPCACGASWPLLRQFAGRPFGKPMSAAAVRR